MNKNEKSNVIVRYGTECMAGVACLWALRILRDLKGSSNISTTFALMEMDEMLRTIGMDDFVRSDYDRETFEKRLRVEKTKCEKNKPVLSGILKDNISRFGAMLGLTVTEIKILEFVCVIRSIRGLSETADTLGAVSNTSVSYYLSAILKAPEKVVRKALSPGSALASAGILRLSGRNREYLAQKLCLMEGLDEALFEEQANVQDLLNEYFVDAGTPDLNVDDFSHINKSFGLLNEYLSEAVKKRYRGVNILVHGVSGTGKSQMARVLAKELSLKLYEINTSDKYGDALTGNNRFTAYQLCQKILSRQNASMILFDEIEDVFPGGSMMLYSAKSNSDRRKAWINNLIETNPVPAIWISNAIGQIDNSFIRRFDLVIKMDHPPKKIRARILQKYLDNLNVSSQWINNVAENPDISPAQVSRAARVTAAIHKKRKRKSDDIENCMEYVIGGSMNAMGYTGNVRPKKHTQMTYRRDVLNPDVDIESLVEGLKMCPHARLCLYGPPGTGKTEFGRYIARTLDKPLMIKRGSDLLDMYVGMTEMNISEMFKQSANEGAVLLLDEADSFLRDRKHARQSWEVTQVNEMLVQMENFDGIFICSTNLIDGLDEASTRRFDFKICLNYLTPEKSWALFLQTLKDIGTDNSATQLWQKSLARFHNLTPGDFANVVRQSRLSKEPLDAKRLFSGLEKESNFKQKDNSKGMGFTAELRSI